MIRFIKPRYIIDMSITHRALSLLGMMLASSAYATDPVPPLPADPLTVEVETGDADRFAALFERTGGKPSAERLQRDYLDRGSYGVQVFTPDRIVLARPAVGWVSVSGSAGTISNRTSMLHCARC